MKYENEYSLLNQQQQQSSNNENNKRISPKNKNCDKNKLQNNFKFKL